MHILAGSLKGRKIVVPDGRNTRPTLSRVRQVLFDILSHSDLLPHWSQVSVVDVFAGSGSIGLEALSRGARAAEFFESDPNARQSIQYNIQQFGLSAVAQIYPDAKHPARMTTPRGLLFFDPPYDEADQLQSCVQKFFDQGWCDDYSLIVTQMPVDIPAFAEQIRSKKIGVTRLDFYTGLGFSNRTGTE